MKKLTMTTVGNHFINLNLGDIVRYKSKLCFYKGSTSIYDFRGEIDVFIFQEINNKKLHALTENDIITVAILPK